MGLDELERITVLRDKLRGVDRWRQCIHGPPGSAKRTAAVEIIADVIEASQGTIFVISLDRGLSRFAHLLAARSLESRRLDGQQLRELAADFNTVSGYSGINLVSESIVNSSVSSAVFDNSIAMLVFDDPMKFDVESLWDMGKTFEIERILWLSTTEPNTQLVNVSVWPALHQEYTKFMRVLHSYSPEDGELALFRTVCELQDVLPAGNPLSNEIARASASSLAALDYTLLRAVGDDDLSDDIRVKLLDLLEQLSMISSDSKNQRIKEIIDEASANHCRVLVLTNDTTTLADIIGTLVEANITASLANDMREVFENDTDVIIGDWPSIVNLDLVQFDDVVLCDLPTDLNDWNRLATNLLRPKTRKPATIHAFSKVGDLDPYTDHLLARWRFTRSAS